MQIPAEQLTAFITEIFVTAGARQEVASEVATHLVEANLKGHDSHGVGMTPASLLRAFATATILVGLARMRNTLLHKA
jgi:hydroxycarboxylate dehydrogenase B